MCSLEPIDNLETIVRRLTYHITPADHPFGKQLKIWTRKYAKRFRPLFSYIYNYEIVNMMPFAYDASVTTEGFGRAFIKVEENITESVLFHELMHLYVQRIDQHERFGEFVIFPDGLGLHSRRILSFLYRVFEEWFVELLIFDEGQSLKDNPRALHNFFGRDYETYANQLDHGLHIVPEKYYSNVPLFLHFINQHSYAHMRALYYQAIMEKHAGILGIVPPVIPPGKKRDLVNIFLKYGDIDKLDKSYYMHFAVDFLNALLMPHSKTMGPIVTLQGDPAMIVFSDEIFPIMASYESDVQGVLDLSPQIEAIIENDFVAVSAEVVNKHYTWIRLSAELFHTEREHLAVHARGIFDEKYADLCKRHGKTNMNPNPIITDVESDEDWLYY